MPEEVFEELFRKLRIKREGFGRYRIEDEVGQGGMGVVLRVWDDELKRHLAMKLIRGGFCCCEEGCRKRRRGCAWRTSRSRS